MPLQPLFPERERTPMYPVPLTRGRPFHCHIQSSCIVTPRRQIRPPLFLWSVLSLIFIFFSLPISQRTGRPLSAVRLHVLGHKPPKESALTDASPTTTAAAAAEPDVSPISTFPQRYAAVDTSSGNPTRLHFPLLLFNLFADT